MQYIQSGHAREKYFEPSQKVRQVEKCDAEMACFAGKSAPKSARRRRFALDLEHVLPVVLAFRSDSALAVNVFYAERKKKCAFGL